jgi:hypothetical protein
MQQHLVDKARKSMFVLEKYIRPFINLPLQFVCDLFDKLIAPILHYNCEVWGFISGDDIERLHLSFCTKNYYQLSGVLKTYTIQSLCMASLAV